MVLLARKQAGHRHLYPADLHAPFFEKKNGRWTLGNAGKRAGRAIEKPVRGDVRAWDKKKKQALGSVQFLTAMQVRER